MFAVASDLVRAVSALWRPPPIMSLSQWADDKFALSAESAAESGKWHTIPYQREPMDCMTDPMVERITWMKSARVGYTKTINAGIAYHIDHDPCSMLVVQPTIPDAEGYSKEEIAPMLRDVPCLVGKVDDARAKDSGNTILHKKFKGGILSMCGANSPAGFRRISRRVLFLDEVDGYPESAGSEGDPVRLAEKRTTTFWNRKIIEGSTPTDHGRSRIERQFEAGDQRRYYVPCPDCGFFQILKFPNLHWPEEWKAGQDVWADPSAVYFECEECKAHIPHDAKHGMVEAGEWRAHAPFHGHASFHIWTAYSLNANATWAHIVAEFLDANRAGVLELKTFVNTVLGETWKDKGEAPEWQRLYDRREDYRIGVVPWGGLFLTGGVDVQKDRLIWEIVAWGRGKESWSVDQGVFPGDTSSDAPWRRLDEMLSSSWPHASGVEMPIQMLAVDSGYNTQQVYSWGRKYPLNRVMAIKGTDKANLIVGSPSRVDVNIRGKKFSRAYKVWPIGVSIAKSEFYGWLRLDKPTTEGGESFPPGFAHFPQYDAEFFKQISAEQLIQIKSRKGRTRLEWTILPNRENHALDCRIYARAAAAVCGLDRMRETHWKELERRVGMRRMDDPDAAKEADDLSDLEAEEPTEEPATDDTAPEPAKPEPPKPQQAKAEPKASPKPTPTRRAPWIKRRQGWMNRER